MSNVKVKLDYAAIGEVLKGSGCKSLVGKAASERLGRLPSGYAMFVGQTSQRARASVYTDTFKAMLDNWKNQTLLKALR